MLHTLSISKVLLPFISHMLREVASNVSIQHLRDASGRRSLSLDFNSNTDLAKGVTCCDAYVSLIDVSCSLLKNSISLEYLIK